MTIKLKTPLPLAKSVTLELRYGKYLANIFAMSYSNGALAVVINDSRSGEPVATASINIEGVSEHLPFDTFVCKSYSENSGMVDALIDLGLVELVAAPKIQFGFTSGDLVKLAPTYSKIILETLNAQA